jgi:hypothetical protein
MKFEKNSLNFYVSAWGQFQIPEGLAERTKWRYLYGEFLQGRQMVKEPEPTADNHEFFSWLHDQEVRAGKPV